MTCTRALRHGSVVGHSKSSSVQFDKEQCWPAILQQRQATSLFNCRERKATALAEIRLEQPAKWQ